jgi:hypothetical protein
MRHSPVMTPEEREDAEHRAHLSRPRDVYLQTRGNQRLDEAFASGSPTRTAKEFLTVNSRD